MYSFFGDGSALIISGNALTDINLERFFAFHKENGGISIGIKRVADPFG
jgi:NDP-sugar pyrophosphorylase family protein